MYIVEEMRTNKFVDCEIPSPKSLFEQYGYNRQAHAGDVGKDGEFAQPCNLGDNETRLDSLARTGATMYEAMSAARYASQTTATPASEPAVSDTATAEP